MGAYLTHALDENGNLVHVDNVAKGAKCGCRCPHCYAPLYAKNGGKWPEPRTRIHHFAHAHGHECAGAYESSLHLLAKEVLKEAGGIMLPPPDNPSFPSGYVHIHNVEIEKLDDRYGIKPDAEGILDSGERLLIEFCVSHKVDENKRQIIIDNHLKCIEIDINYKELDKEVLKQFLVGSDEERKWIVPQPHLPKAKDSFSYGRNPIYEQARDCFKEIIDEGTIMIRPHDRPYDLRQLGYDVCAVNTKYLRFKCDLLLYRSQKEDKGYISINFRGRGRSEDFRRPGDLRIIDVILNHSDSIDSVKQKLKKDSLSGYIGLRVEYYGFK